MKDRADHLSASFYFFGSVGFPNLVASAFAFRLMQSLLLGTLVQLIKVVPVYLRQHLVDGSDCDICLFVLANGELRLPVGLVILPSITEKRIIYFVLFRSLVVRLLLHGEVPAIN